MPTQTTLSENSNSTPADIPKLSLVQYLPKNSHSISSNVPPVNPQSQNVTDSLPAEEFSDSDSTLDAGPDIIRHPDVLDPIVRRRLVEQGRLRLLRVRAGQPIDGFFIVDSLTGRDAAVATNAPKTEGTLEKGSWFGWTSAGHTPSSALESATAAAEAKLQDGKLNGSRVGVMACLPVQ